MGLLGAGVDQYNKVSDRQDRRSIGREFDQALGGNLMADPRTQAHALARAGLVNGSEFLRNSAGMYAQEAAARRSAGAAGARAAAADRARQMQYVQAVEPYMAKQQRITGALGALDNAATGPEWWATPEASAARSVVNEAVGILRNDYFTGTLGRTDAPSQTEADDLARMFPMMSDSTFDKNYVENVRGMLKRAEATNAAAISRERVRSAGSVPGGNVGGVLDTYMPQPNDGLPAGWTGD